MTDSDDDYLTEKEVEKIEAKIKKLQAEYDEKVKLVQSLFKIIGEAEFRKEWKEADAARKLQGTALTAQEKIFRKIERLEKRIGI